MKFFIKPPNGYLVQGLVIYNWVAKGGCAVKGFAIENTDFRQAPDYLLNEAQDRLRYLSHGMTDVERWQFSRTTTSNFDPELTRFEAITETVAHPWIRRRREEVARRYREKMMRGELRRQQLVLFISRKIETSAGWLCNGKELARRYQTVLDQLNCEFQTRQMHLQQALAPLGIRVTPMGDQEHFLEFARMLNPDLADATDPELLRMYDPDQTILDNAWRSEGVGHFGGDATLGGCEHSIVAVSRLPQKTDPRIMDGLTALKLRHYQIVLSIEMLPVNREISRIEGELTRVRGDLAAGGPARLKTAVEIKDVRIEDLTRGFIRPFRIRLVIRTWAVRRETARDQMAAIKHAIISMNGAQFCEPNLPSTTGNLFIEILPGWTFGSYKHHKLYATSAFLTDLIPLSSRFTGYLAQADALFDGPEDSLVAVRIFSQENERGEPEHGTCMSSSGGGKSVLLQSLMSQIAHLFGRILILDADHSWAPFLQAFDPSCKAIILGPNSNTRINYLSTEGLPLLPDLLATMIGLVEAMAGRHLDPDKQQTRRTCIETAVQRAYDHTYDRWCHRHPDLVVETGRLACAIDDLAAKAGLPWHEAYFGFNDLRAKNPQAAEEFLSRIDEARAVKATIQSGSKILVRNLALAKFATEEYPIHSMLQELMQLDGASGDRNESRTIAQNLKVFNRGGSVGDLIDGPSTVSTSSSNLLCLDIGAVDSTNDAFLELSARRALGCIEREVFRTPRNVRKAVILEECSTWLRLLPKAEELIQSVHERGRKHGAWVCSTFQQYARVASGSKSFRSALMGNITQAYLLRQHDERDLLELAEDLGLSRPAIEAIKGYGIPNQTGVLPAFTYFHRDTPLPVCGTAVNVLPPDVLDAFRSTGADFERRRRSQNPAALVEQLVMNSLL